MWPRESTDQPRSAQARRRGDVPTRGRRHSAATGRRRHPDWPSEPISAEAVRTSCPEGTEESAETLARYRAIWDAAGIDSYDFTLQILGMFLYGTYQISVVDGTPVSVERLEGDLGPDVDLLEIPELPKTIDAVFDQLEREVTGDDFAADFDDELGYPTHVLVDRIADAIDDELEFYISDFTVTSTPVAPGAVDVAVTTVLDVEAQLRGLVGDAVNASASIPGMIVHVEAPGRGLDVSVAAGVADRATGAPLGLMLVCVSPATPRRSRRRRSCVSSSRTGSNSMPRSLSLSLPRRSRCWPRVAIGPT